MATEKQPEIQIAFNKEEFTIIRQAMETRLAQLSRAANTEKDSDVKRIREAQLNAGRNLLSRILTKEII